MTHDEAMKKAEEFLDVAGRTAGNSSSANTRTNIALAYIDLAREIRKNEKKGYSL